MREEAQTKRRSQVTEFKTLDHLDLNKLTFLNPAQPQNTQVLQPIPAQQTNFKISSYDMLTENINISDFESDTSSPFDNMELKTINDLEELASVLKPTSVLNNTSNKTSELSDLSISQCYPTPIYNNHSEVLKSNKLIHTGSIQSNQSISSISMLKEPNIFEDKNTAPLPPVSMPNVLLQLKADLNTLKYNDESSVSIIKIIKLLMPQNIISLDFLLDRFSKITSIKYYIKWI